MQLYSTNNPDNIVDLKEAVLKSLPKDKGLYMPTHIPKLSSDFIEHIEDYSFADIAFEVASTLMDDIYLLKTCEALLIER